MADLLPSSSSSDDVPAPRVRKPWWQSAPVLSLAVTVVLLGGALAWPLLKAPEAGTASAPMGDLPWQVQPDGQGGSRVFGLALGQGADLAAVRARWGQDLIAALIAPPGQPPALEAYVEGFNAGFVSGKLVLALRTEPGWVAQAQARSTKRDIGEGAVRRWGLAPDDLDQALGFAVKALAFIPAARLDEATVQQRFGAPAERVTSPDGALHLLYPGTGVAVALPPAQGEGARAKAVIQYVAPRDFEALLRQPLRDALKTPAASPASAASR